MYEKVIMALSRKGITIFNEMFRIYRRQKEVIALKETQLSQTRVKFKTLNTCNIFYAVVC